MQIKVKSSPYILVVRKVVVSLKCQKEINHLKIKDMLELIKGFGEFNNWRGCIGIYFTQKDLRPLKKLGITTETSLKDAYTILSKI